jgi:hypothetical protein
MNRLRLNLVLLALAVGLAVAVWFAQKKEPAGPPLTALAPDAVTRIAIEHPGAPAIRLEKQDGAWMFTAPIKARVDEFEIASLVGLADQKTQEKLEGAKLAELELDPPKYAITLNDTKIEFGGVEPLQYRRYVKVGDAAWLIEDPPSAALDKDHADLVAKNLLPPDAQIERIELKQLTLAKDADGKWAVQPADPKATADGMQKLADAWKGARAMWNERAGAEPPRGERAKITLKGGAVHEFVVAGAEPQLKLYSAAAGINYVLSKALAEDLLKLPEPAKEEPKPVEVPK